MAFDQRLREFRESLNDSDFAVPVEAERFVAKMKREHPDELSEWMHGAAIRHAAAALGDNLRRERTRTVEQIKRSTFATAAKAATDANDPAPLGLFATPFVIDKLSNLRRPLGEMVGPDAIRAGDIYVIGAKTQLAVGAFLREVGKRAGRKKVKSVMSEADAERLLRSFFPDAEPVLELVA